MAAKPKQPDIQAKFFLVLVDESEELHQALYYACMRAKSTGLRVALLYVVAPAEFAHWAGVGELMREEARDRAEDSVAMARILYGTETFETSCVIMGNVVEEVISLINEEEGIISLVLGADTESDSAGPVISHLSGRGIGQCRVPVVIVPGNLSDDQIDVLCQRS